MHAVYLPDGSQRHGRSHIDGCLKSPAKDVENARIMRFFGTVQRGNHQDKGMKPAAHGRRTAQIAGLFAQRSEKMVEAAGVEADRAFREFAPNFAMHCRDVTYCAVEICSHRSEAQLRPTLRRNFVPNCPEIIVGELNRSSRQHWINRSCLLRRRGVAPTK
jgi:hypothetical protein